MKNFADLSPREILAVAIASEEEDARIYMAFAEDLRERYPASSKVFEEMAEEETSHRHMLLEIFEKRFGKKGVVDLTGINAYYALLAMQLNVAQYPMPKDGKKLVRLPE